MSTNLYLFSSMEPGSMVITSSANTKEIMKGIKNKAGTNNDNSSVINSTIIWNLSLITTMTMVIVIVKIEIKVSLPILLWNAAKFKIINNHFQFWYSNYYQICHWKLHSSRESCWWQKWFSANTVSTNTPKPIPNATRVGWDVSVTFTLIFAFNISNISLNSYYVPDVIYASWKILHFFYVQQMLLVPNWTDYRSADNVSMAAADMPIPIPRVISVGCGTFKFPSSFAFIPFSNLSLFFYLFISYKGRRKLTLRS